MPVVDDAASESIAPSTACKPASAVPLATIGLRPWLTILPSWSTRPTATLVPPISTPRIGLRFFASVMFGRRRRLNQFGELYLDGLDLVRLRMDAHSAIAHRQVS